VVESEKPNINRVGIKQNKFIMTSTENYILVEFVSEKGNKFAIGYPKSEGYTKENIDLELKKLDKNLIKSSGGFQSIRLVPDGESIISTGAKDIGIVNANVKTNNPPIPYEYTLTFRNNKGWGFTFKDESNDTYYCSTFRNANHTIWYNSSKPIMIGVK